MLNPKIHHYLTVQWILQWIVPPYTFGSGCMPSKWQFWWWEWWTMIIYNDKEWKCEHPVFRQTHLEVYHQVPVGKSYFAPIQAPIQCQFRCHSTSVDGVNFHFAKPPLESLQGMWTRFSEKLVGGLIGARAPDQLHVGVGSQVERKLCNLTASSHPWTSEVRPLFQGYRVGASQTTGLSWWG